jgi:branched-chain amino acid transport system substrate-binding protein
MLRKLLLAVAAALGLASSPGAWPQSIKFAVLGPMAYAYGENHWAGAEMARDEINQAGGIALGSTRRPVEIIKVDTNEIQSVADAALAVQRAVNVDKADFLVGGFRSDAVLAMQEAAMDLRKMFLGVGAANDRLGLNVEQNYGRYKYWFRVAPMKSSDLGRTLFAALEAVAGQVRKESGRERPKVAIFAEKAEWAQPMIKVAQLNLPRLGMNVVGVWQAAPQAAEVTAELEAIRSAEADIVFTLLSGPLGVVFGRQMGELKIPAVAFGINVEGQKDGYWQATGGRGGYVSTLDTYAEVEVTPNTREFVKAFKQRYKRAPIYTAATYDAIMLVRAAIERSGSIDADELVAAIEKMEYAGTAAVTRYDKRHDPVWEVGKSSGIAVQWQDSEKVPFWPPQITGMKPFRMPKQ